MAKYQATYSFLGGEQVTRTLTSTNLLDANTEAHALWNAQQGALAGEASRGQDKPVTTAAYEGVEITQLEDNDEAETAREAVTKKDEDARRQAHIDHIRDNADGIHRALTDSHTDLANYGNGIADPNKKEAFQSFHNGLYEGADDEKASVANIRDNAETVHDSLTEYMADLEVHFANSPDASGRRRFEQLKAAVGAPEERGAASPAPVAQSNMNAAMQRSIDARREAVEAGQASGLTPQAEIHVGSDPNAQQRQATRPVVNTTATVKARTE